jgi:acetyl-CoA C-acetyltransferase
MEQAYIVSAIRTAGGRRGGKLNGWHPVDLGALTVDAAIERACVDPARVQDLIMGCVSQVGEQAFNIARGIVLASKILPVQVPGVTVDRQCGSSQQAIQFAAQAVMSGVMDVVVAGGVESMSRVPMGSPETLATKAGLAGPISLGMLANLPGFEYNQFRCAEMIAKKYGLNRDTLDEFGFLSQKSAAEATEAGRFKEEILGVRIGDGADDIHKVDEGIRFGSTLAAVKGVKTIVPDGALSAATASQVCDGAAAVVVASEQAVRSMNLKPLARVHHMSVVGDDPVIMLEAPIPATKAALRRSGLSIDQIDLYEVNEAFASIPLAWAQALEADPNKMNVNGGAIALGHPLGASGAKLAATLIHALRARNARYGLQTMCEGGGLANVTIFERL